MFGQGNTTQQTETATQNQTAIPAATQEYIDQSLGFADQFGASVDEMLTRAYNSALANDPNDATACAIVAQAYAARAAVHQKNAEIALQKLHLEMIASR